MADCTCADPTLVVQAIQNHDQARSENTDLIDETLYGSALTAGTGHEPGGSGHHGAIGPVRFCRWAAPEVTGDGETWWAIAYKAAALAIAFINGMAQSEIEDMQMDLAEGYYDQAKSKWDRFINTYGPLEKKLLAEVSTEPIREMDCDGAQSRAETAVRSAYAFMDDYARMYGRQMALCIDPSLIAVMDRREQLALVDTTNYNLQDERWFTDYRNDKRWNRRSSVLNLGRNMTSEALKYGQLTNDLLNRISSQLNTAAGTLMQSLGYYGTRMDTMTPNTYLSGTGAQLGATIPAAITKGTNAMNGLYSSTPQD